MATNQKSYSISITRRRLLQFASNCAAVAGLSGISAFVEQARAQGRGKVGGTLSMVSWPEPQNFGSYASTADGTGTFASKCYDGLLEYDFDLKPKPSLAKSWTTSADGKTVTFELQKGVTFHDGKPFTSADVEFSVMNVLRKLHPRAINTFGSVVAIETPDPYTAVFKLKDPAPYMLTALSGYESPMLPKHLLEGVDPRTAPLMNHPVGTGPFKFAEWERGQYVRLDRNPNYWKKGQPYLDRIVSRFVSSAATRAASLQAGQVVYAGGNFGINPSDAKRLKEVPNIEVATKGYDMFSPIVLLEMNTRRAPFNNQKVRQAISYLIDRRFVVDNIWSGFGKPATGPISSNLERTGMYTSKVRDYSVPNRVEIANKLLDEAGYPKNANGIRFSFAHDILPFGNDWMRLGEYLKESFFQQAGIAVTLRYEDFGTFIQRVFTNYDFSMTSDFLFTLPDPVIGVYRTYASWSILKGAPFSNCSGYASPVADDLMKRGAIEIDPGKRNEIYHELQRTLVEDAPYAWIFEAQPVDCYNKSKVHDLITSPLGHNGLLDQAWLSSA